jgi:two-component system, NarL family, sensor histidine kinase LiaS
MNPHQAAALELPMLIDPDPSCPLSRKELWAERDLLSALRRLIKESETLGGITVHFFHDRVPSDLSSARRLAILCIVREALANAVKHAKTKRVLLSLCRRGKTIELAIDDNGIGFDVERRRKSCTPANGLLIMEERASEAGGRLSIQSFVRGGTRVMAKIPLA